MAVFGKDKEVAEEAARKKAAEEEAAKKASEEAAARDAKFATKEDIAEIKGAIEQVNLAFKQFGQPQTPTTPPTPSGPTVDEQVATLDQELAALDEPFETAIREGKGAIDIQKKRERLIQKRADLIHRRDFDELRTFGTFAIDRLADEVVSGKLEMLRIPEVKASYEAALSSMPPGQRMNPDTRMLAYKFACGEHMDRIFEVRQQEFLRKEEEAKTQLPTAGGPGREHELSKDDPNYVPKPEEVLSQDNLAALKRVNKTVDEYYRQMGYSGGWAEFWKTDGKTYFEGREEEEE